MKIKIHYEIKDSLYFFYYIIWHWNTNIIIFIFGSSVFNRLEDLGDHTNSYGYIVSSIYQKCILCAIWQENLNELFEKHIDPEITFLYYFIHFKIKKKNRKISKFHYKIIKKKFGIVFS